MKKVVLLFALLMSIGISQAKDNIKFNTHGQLIPPDQVHLARGLKNEKDGFSEAAINSFTKASEYGNEHARFFIGLLHMQEARYSDALAWFYLVNASKINRHEKIQKLKAAAMAELTDHELLMAEEKLISLEQIHNSQQSRVKREKWRKSLKFTGSHSRGRITSGVKIYANARLELKADGSIDLIQGSTVTSSQLRHDLKDFVTNYHYDLPEGNVQMHDIETKD